ncbi:MAG: hypothetical protein K0S61_1334 [Anaerocolumna sp.]|jgi:hypothetical protein|nr:hypothetical protein [Anaerocolumna sp.]
MGYEERINIGYKKRRKYRLLRQNKYLSVSENMSE